MLRLSPTITYSTRPARSISAPICRRVSCDSSANCRANSGVTISCAGRRRVYSFAMRRNWLGFRPAVFPNTSLIFPSFQSCAHSKLRLGAHRLAPSAVYVGIELKLQKECSEQWVSDARELLLMLLCDIASLIRLSITIQFASTLITP